MAFVTVHFGDGQNGRRQLELEPWREEAHRQLMRVLFMGDKRSAALAQYEQCRYVLAQELGAAGQKGER